MAISTQKAIFSPGARLTCLMLLGAAPVHEAVFAQTTGGTAASAATVTTQSSTSSTSSGSAMEGASGGGLTVRPSAAVPLPNPNLAANAAFPDRRGFYRAEPFFIYPWAGLGLGYNSNLNGVRDNPISSSLAVVAARVLGEMKYRAGTLGLSYAGNYGRYFESSVDNFNDHELVARLRNQFTARADLDGAVYWMSKQDPRGLQTRPFSDSPDKWRSFGGYLTAGYGAQSAQGRFEVDLGFSNKEYTNNREFTQQLDVASVNLAGRFLYRVAPRTRVLVELRDTEYNYLWSQSRLDNSEQRILMGATWDATAALSGTVKAGWMFKDFKDPTQKDFSGLSLEANGRWAPYTYSFYDLAARYGAMDTSGSGTYTVDTGLAAAWTHKWQSFFQTRATLAYLHQDYRGIDRIDNILSVSFGAYYDLRSWLRAGVDASYLTRSSTDPSVEYGRTLLMFTLGGTL